jgi:hypothetical protein
MESTRRRARIAGRIYLALALIAPIGLLYVPGKIFVAGDVARTVENLRAQEGLFRLGMASEVVHQALAVFMVLALYRLFEPVSRPLAQHLVALGALVSVPIVFANVINDLAALYFAKGADFLSAFDRAQQEAMAYLFLRLHSRGLELASLFWGLWLFPFALLVIRSRFIPKVFGWLLAVAGVAYVASSLVAVAAPQLGPVVNPVAGILYVAEVPIIFWLAFVGARETAAAAPDPA